jgi:hypothetical protein
VDKADPLRLNDCEAEGAVGTVLKLVSEVGVTVKLPGHEKPERFKLLIVIGFPDVELALFLQ